MEYFNQNVQWSLNSRGRKEKSSELLRCPECCFKFKYKCNLKPHMLYAHSVERAFGCDRCPFKGASERSLIRHTLNVHSEEKPYACEFPSCSFTSLHQARFERHLERHREKLFYCSLCPPVSEGFLSRWSLKDHLRTHQDPKEEDQFSFPNFEESISNLFQIPTEDKLKKMIKCSMCDYQSIYLCNVKRHEKRHQSQSFVKSFNCKFNYCQFKTLDEKLLALHFNWHKIPFVALNKIHIK